MSTVKLVIQESPGRPPRVTLETITTELPIPDEDESSGLPASVLQYERQRRKVQHAQCHGAAVPSLDVIHVDESMVVVNKPPRVLTVPGVHSRDSLLQSVHTQYAVDTPNTSHLVAHRLDMDTSGLVVFGRHREATRQLQALFREDRIHKVYQALLVEHFPYDEVLLDLPMHKDARHPPFWRVATPSSVAYNTDAVQALQKHGYRKLMDRSPRPSQTILKVLERSRRDNLPFTRVQLQPLTGRTHQLRVHCAALGFWIVGDPTYSLGGEGAPQGGLAGCIDPLDGACSLEEQQAWLKHHRPNDARMCLHATKLEFRHPVTNEELQFEVAPDF